jgi:hypothetical protein
MENKLLKLLQQIEQKSSAGELTWELTAKKNSFQVSFPSFSIEVTQYNDIYELRIINSEGQVVDSVDSYYDGGTIDSASYKAKKSLETIWREARRKAMDADQVLDDILATLGA